MTTKRTASAAVFALTMLVASVAAPVGAVPADASDSDALDPTHVSSDRLAQETANQSANDSTSVTFGDQTSNGSSVVVNESTLPEGGFLVVYAQDGSILGNSTYLESGTYENVTVELTESPNRSQVLIAIPHRDTDDDQQFEFNESVAEQAARSTATPDASDAASLTDLPYTEDQLPVSAVAFVTLSGGDSSRATTADESASRTAPS